MGVYNGEPFVLGFTEEYILFVTQMILTLICHNFDEK